MKVVLLKNDRIDRQKYDECVIKSPHGTVYALSWYLDVVSPDWKLLIAEDYSYVMPLPVRRKFGIIPYVIQPVLCQQLGLFSSQEISLEVMNSFFRKIRYPFALFQLNTGDTLRSKNMKLRPNYYLNLNKPYQELKGQYHRNTQYDLKRAAGFNLLHREDTSIGDFLSFVRKCSRYYTGHIFSYLEKLIHATSKRELMTLCSVCNGETFEILAGAFFIRFKNRYYFLCSVSSKEGKARQAMRYLLDKFIEERAGTDTILDFEGSTIPSVALFYESFGSVFENYSRYYKNYVPFVSKVKI